MATAPKKVRAKQAGRDARNLRELPALAFLVQQDNGGDYYWEIVGERGENVARSGTFASYDDAERAARSVRDGAGSARFEPRVADKRVLAVV
jgi:uncharacterized protein YegP (UPF0339 family)